MRLTQRVAVWRWLRAVGAPVPAICCGGLRLKGVAVSRANMRLDALVVRSVTDSADRILPQWPAEPRLSPVCSDHMYEQGREDIAEMPHNCDEPMMAWLNEATASRNVYHSLIVPDGLFHS